MCYSVIIISKGKKILEISKKKQFLDVFNELPPLHSFYSHKLYIQSFKEDSCLCPYDIDKYLTDNNLEFKRESEVYNDYLVEMNFSTKNLISKMFDNLLDLNINE